MKLDFKSSNRGKFFDTVSKLRQDRKIDANRTAVTSVPLNVPAVSMLFLNGQSTHQDGDDMTDLVLYSNHERFPQRTGSHQELEKTLDRVGRETDFQVRSLLGYSIKGGIRKEWMSDHQHRALFLGAEMRGRGASEFLYKTMVALEGQPEKETTYVPSLLYFHMKQGFEVDKIHIPISYADMSPMYDLDEEQKKRITDYILWCLDNGDLSLPFFVELKYTGNKFSKENYTLGEIPKGLIEILGFFQTISDKGYRQFRFIDKSRQRCIEYFLGLEKTNLTRLEKIKYGLQIDKILKTP